jgi:hypothetical protein
MPRFVRRVADPDRCGDHRPIAVRRLPFDSREFSCSAGLVRLEASRILVAEHRLDRGGASAARSIGGLFVEAAGVAPGEDARCLMPPLQPFPWSIRQPQKPPVS